MFGDFGKMLSLLGDLKTRLPEIQRKLEESTFTGQAGEGAVSVVVNGKLKIIDIKISPDAIGDTAALEDMLKAAVSSAQSQAGAAAKAAVSDLTGGMEIPGLSGLGGML